MPLPASALVSNLDFDYVPVTSSRFLADNPQDVFFFPSNNVIRHYFTQSILNNGVKYSWLLRVR